MHYFCWMFPFPSFEMEGLVLTHRNNWRPHLSISQYRVVVDVVAFRLRPFRGPPHVLLWRVDRVSWFCRSVFDCVFYWCCCVCYSFCRFLACHAVYVSFETCGKDGFRGVVMFYVPWCYPYWCAVFCLCITHFEVECFALCSFVWVVTCSYLFCVVLSCYMIYAHWCCIVILVRGEALCCDYPDWCWLGYRLWWCVWYVIDFVVCGYCWFCVCFVAGVRVRLILFGYWYLCVNLYVLMCDSCVRRYCAELF